MNEITLYKCQRCGEYSFGLCARGRCHGIPQKPGVIAKPIKGEPVVFIPKTENVLGGINKFP